MTNLQMFKVSVQAARPLATCTKSRIPLTFNGQPTDSTTTVYRIHTNGVEIGSGYTPIAAWRDAAMNIS